VLSVNQKPLPQLNVLKKPEQKIPTADIICQSRALPPEYSACGPKAGLGFFTFLKYLLISAYFKICTFIAYSVYLVLGMEYNAKREAGV